MKRANRHEILRDLSGRWEETGKRHLYLVLGTYADLAAFLKDVKRGARTPDRRPVEAVIRVNSALLETLGESGQEEMVDSEARYLEHIQQTLARHFDGILKTELERHDIVVLADLELIFAFSLDLAVLRQHATNGKHVVLLIPGRREGERIVLFREAEQEFRRSLPVNLVMENHIWEIAHGA